MKNTMTCVFGVAAASLAALAFAAPAALADNQYTVGASDNGQTRPLVLAEKRYVPASSMLLTDAPRMSEIRYHRTRAESRTEYQVGRSGAGGLILVDKRYVPASHAGER